MKVIKSLTQMLALCHHQDAKVGFVPTMGYLHEGHLSLVDAAKKECNVTIVSIFVNPAQFGPQEDLANYPRDLERDLKLLEERGVDYVFFPDKTMMYPKGFRTWVEVSELSDLLCGVSRPGHFRGVCTVVLKLVNIIKPRFMYMGEKDFQQLSILRIMLKDLNLTTQIVACPIVREADGLAKSSRNIYLSAQERTIATSLYRALYQARDSVNQGILDAHALVENAITLLTQAGAKPDYVAIVDARDLSEVISIDSHSRMLIAAFVGKTRLIDNMMLK
ncbi:MAG: pantoate--beta-alanine ligase [Candidatus Cloacimonetes bacterium]|jgi:pantoate--beta-alanine ligase|nr:pantoate--beta-alanine ligase [Candidatus Cloacimonadota bacterium]MDD2211080.1 pantoate--beta-alanine ligase [Candidatus Cloacimonadota bacterium]MDD4232287.1 pantoate--beta-alanine ligase [Candidatus Cloacimonadota bacterium]MDD4687779.1 pantoate--beta-alanine ligase [Candidatus Cloacimonadota bacterium]MDY0299703.1 pantoate--beta-alanine ligase [Candidatus Cloacimonadaceae bacterium]